MGDIRLRGIGAMWKSPTSTWRRYLPDGAIDYSFKRVGGYGDPSYSRSPPLTGDCLSDGDLIFAGGVHEKQPRR